MNLFKRTLQEDNAALDLCIRVASLCILAEQRPRAKEYAQTESDVKRSSLKVESLLRYITECGNRKAGNLECIEAGKCLARIHDIGKIDYLHELNRIRDFAARGEWSPRQYLPGPEPYEPITFLEIDAMIARITEART